MDQAPIDIRYGELLTWLESRFLIPKDWAKRLELIGVKKGEFLDAFFLKDSGEMKKLLGAAFELPGSSQGAGGRTIHLGRQTTSFNDFSIEAGILIHLGT